MSERSSGNDSGTNPAIMRMLEELTKRIESGEKKIEDNDKKVKTYNSRVDQIPGASPVLKGLDAKKFIQKPFPQSAVSMPIPKMFRMPDVPKYNGTIEPQRAITSYTCGIKGNDLNNNEIDDAFVKAHAGAIKVATRKTDIFKIKQRNDKMLREFVSRFQIERMEILSISCAQPLPIKNQGRGQLVGSPSGLVHPNRFAAKPPRDADRESRSNKERYQPYVDYRNHGSGRNAPLNDRGQSSRGLMSKSRFDKHTDPVKEPRLSEYNFSIDASGIVSAIGRIKDTRWPRPIQTVSSQRNPNLMCKHHGTHCHKTEDCRQLREEVARLFNEGRLREFFSDQAKNHFRERDARKNEQEEPHHVIHMIISGVDVPQRPIFKRTKVKWTRSYDLEDALSFYNEEVEGISQPHNDALVIEYEDENFLTPRTSVVPEESNATKSMIEELEQVIQIEYMPERKI
uniref:Reverse transcriptase domain-containing protein n=1 Tax=Nicotiana tabacum TaxID=4097 RepID=A0A1S4A926_TOBAC|nr:PREDICTED: uncharacterized protein LOC107795084 [Nicotiana tabacum]